MPELNVGVVENKRKSRLQKEVDFDNERITITVEGYDPLVVDVNAFSDEIKTKCMLHGASAKIGDSAAGCTELSDSYDAIKDTIDNLISGKWVFRKAGGAPKITKSSIKDAFENLTPQEKEASREFLKKLGISLD